MLLIQPGALQAEGERIELSRAYASPVFKTGAVASRRLAPPGVRPVGSPESPVSPTSGSVVANATRLYSLPPRRTGRCAERITGNGHRHRGAVSQLTLRRLHWPCRLDTSRSGRAESNGVHLLPRQGCDHYTTPRGGRSRSVVCGEHEHEWIVSIRPASARGRGPASRVSTVALGAQLPDYIGLGGASPDAAGALRGARGKKDC